MLLPINSNISVAYTKEESFWLTYSVLSLVIRARVGVGSPLTSL